jgi:hypothetical protein
LEEDGDVRRVAEEPLCRCTPFETLDGGVVLDFTDVGQKEQPNIRRYTISVHGILESGFGVLPPAFCEILVAFVW